MCGYMDEFRTQRPFRKVGIKAHGLYNSVSLEMIPRVVLEEGTGEPFRRTQWFSFRLSPSTFKVIEQGGHPLPRY